MKKTFMQNKILLGVLLFVCAIFIFNSNIYAYDKCSSWDGKTKASCQAQNENGYQCIYTTEYIDAFDFNGKKVCKVNYNECARGYKSTGNGCNVVKLETDRCSAITYDTYGAALDEVCNAAHQYTAGIGVYRDDGACKYAKKNDKWGCYLASSLNFSTCGTTNNAWGSVSECTNRGYKYDSAKKCCDTSDMDTNSYCSNSDSTGVTYFKNKYGNTINQDHCNSTVDDNWRSDWTNGCCYISARNNTGGNNNLSAQQSCESNGNYWANGACYALDEPNCAHFGFCWENGRCNRNRSCNVNSGVSTSSKYNIWFDAGYGGVGLTCTNPYSTQSNSNPIVCTGEVNSGTSVTLPTNLKNSEGLYLLGWSKTLYNNKVVCDSSKIIKKSSDKINSSSYYYACYKEDIGGYRYVMSNHIADGGEEDYSCGQKVWIDYCVKDSTGDYCYYNLNGLRKVNRYRLANNEAGALATCSQSGSEDGNTETQELGYRYVSDSGNNYSCGDQLYITYCESDTLCHYNKIKTSSSEVSQEGTINRNDLKTSESAAKDACKEDSEEESEFDKLKSCSNKKQNNMIGTNIYEDFCYKKSDSNSEINEKIISRVSCKNGYNIKDIYNADGSKTCNKNGICVNDFSITCTFADSKPILSVTSGMVQSNGYGVIKVKATAAVGKIVQYFASDYFIIPTSSDRWIDVKSETFTIESSPGTKYIWVKDSFGNISNAVSGAVLDTVNNDTTVNKLELYDENGNIQAPSRISYSGKNVKSSKYVLMSNNLNSDSEILADGFNPYDMEYRLEVDSPTISVYATLTSTDSKYVEGFEPRTVNLNYGMNTILIKIVNKEGIVRTYTILVTRKDTRTSDNTLKELSVSVGEINFNANVTDYKIEIPKSTKTVEVKASIASDKAEYEVGYEPGNVEITGDTTVKIIKVKSQTGSLRTYVLTFVKEGTDTITKESLQLSDLVIPNVNIPFEEDVANYSFSVGYDIDSIDINTVKKDENSTVIIKSMRRTDFEFGVVSNKGIVLDVGENFIEITVIDLDGEESHYRLTIIRKEFGLEVSNDTTLKDLRVLDYNINFKPNKKEYTVKIKTEKSLVITAVPNSNRAEVFIRGNEELTGFSTVRVKVVAENGEFETYSIDIKKDAYNKTIEIGAVILGVLVLVSSSIFIIKNKKSKSNKEYFEE